VRSDPPEQHLRLKAHFETQNEMEAEMPKLFVKVLQSDFDA
jgi:hypothetical protein